MKQNEVVFAWEGEDNRWKKEYPEKNWNYETLSYLKTEKLSIWRNEKQRKLAKKEESKKKVEKKINQSKTLNRRYELPVRAPRVVHWHKRLFKPG